MSDVITYWYIYLPFLAIVLYWMWWKKQLLKEGNKEMRDLILRLDKKDEAMRKLIEDDQEDRKRIADILEKLISKQENKEDDNL